MSKELDLFNEALQTLNEALDTMDNGLKQVLTDLAKAFGNEEDLKKVDALFRQEERQEPFIEKIEELFRKWDLDSNVTLKLTAFVVNRHAQEVCRIQKSILNVRKREKKILEDLSSRM